MCVLALTGRFRISHGCSLIYLEWDLYKQIGIQIYSVSLCCTGTRVRCYKQFDLHVDFLATESFGYVFCGCGHIPVER